jgi:hypothetical protein
VRSLFDYLSTVGDSHLQKDIDRIENVQRRAARFIYSDYKRQQVKSAPKKIGPRSNPHEGDMGCFFEFSVAMFEVPSDESKGGIGFITDFIDIC